LAILDFYKFLRCYVRLRLRRIESRRVLKGVNEEGTIPDYLGGNDFLLRS